MDLSKATNKQLYEIARNQENRLIERYAAARELQARREKDALCWNRPKH